MEGNAETFVERNCELASNVPFLQQVATLSTDDSLIQLEDCEATRAYLWWMCPYGSSMLVFGQKWTTRCHLGSEHCGNISNKMEQGLRQKIADVDQ